MNRIARVLALDLAEASFGVELQPVHVAGKRTSGRRSSENLIS